MHMIGAEALARPDVRSTQALAARSHKLSWDSKRFRVYAIETQAQADIVSYAVFGLLVSLSASTIGVINTQGAGAATTRLLGGVIWLDPPVTINFNGTFRGIFIEWI
jgi:hypothetical protein